MLIWQMVLVALGVLALVLITAITAITIKALITELKKP